MVTLFGARNIRATWATVGFLFASGRRELDAHLPHAPTDVRTARARSVRRGDRARRGARSRAPRRLTRGPDRRHPGPRGRVAHVLALLLPRARAERGHVPGGSGRGTVHRTMARPGAHQSGAPPQPVEPGVHRRRPRSWVPLHPGPPAHPGPRCPTEWRPQRDATAPPGWPTPTSACHLPPPRRGTRSWRRRACATCRPVRSCGPSTPPAGGSSRCGWPGCAPGCVRRRGDGRDLPPVVAPPQLLAVPVRERRPARADPRRVRPVGRQRGSAVADHGGRHRQGCSDPVGSDGRPRVNVEICEG